MDKLEKLFQNPTAPYRGKPFWSWNGKLEKDELLRQIENFKKMGMGGYFCHSRIGLITDYLGKEWFELINDCAEKGEQMGMETWLYDEDRWPSGTAGGMVTENPEFRIHYIRLSIIDGDEFSWPEDCLACFTVKLDGFAFTDKKRIHKGDDAKGLSVLQFTVEEMYKEDFYNGYTYVDTMNPKATEKFLETTHEKYEENCGDRLGTTIHGIFTDEPHRGSVMNGFSLSNPSGEFLTPYTGELFPKFQEKFGYDLLENLPELFLWKDGEKISPVKWSYMELLEELFLENYMKPIHEWCQKTGMKFTGHLLHEDTLAAQSCMIGSIMRGYEYMDVPGVDLLGEWNICYWIVKQLTSAARQLGKTQLLSEMYACIGWHVNFETYKAIGDWQALFGINNRCHHLSWYGMKGAAKRDYPASISGQSAWYDEFYNVEDYFSRIHVFMEKGRQVCDVLIVNPVESAWAQIYPKWAFWLGTVDLDLQAIERIYFDTFRTLSEAKLDFDYGDEDFLSRMTSIEVIDGKTVLRVGHAYYRSVLVTGMLTIRGTTVKLLQEFARRGGNVVFAGETPHYVDALKSEDVKKVKGSFIPYEKEKIVAGLKVKSIVSVKGSYGENVGDIFAQVRRDGEDYYIFLLNINREKAYRNCVVELSVGGYCEKWDPRTGRVGLLAKGKKIRFVKDFEADEELLLHVTPADHGYGQIAPLGEALCTVVPKGPFEYRMTEPNVMTLSFVDYQVDDEPWVAGKDILIADQEVRKKLQMAKRGGEGLQPWFIAKQEKKTFCSLKLRYPFQIEKMPEKLRLVVEAPEDFNITVNGVSGAIRPTDDFWVDIYFKVFELDTSVLKPGENEITLTTGFRNDINPEAIYLLGDFGVAVKGITSSLSEKPAKLEQGDITPQGLPYYGAGLAFTVPVPQVENGAKLYLEFDIMSGGCVRVSNGKGQKVICAHPYRADITELAKGNETLQVEYILTRRNTFEPLHHEPQFTGKYDFLPQGMMSDIRLVVRK